MTEKCHGQMGRAPGLHFKVPEREGGGAGDPLDLPSRGPTLLDLSGQTFGFLIPYTIER